LKIFIYSALSTDWLFSRGNRYNMLHLHLKFFVSGLINFYLLEFYQDMYCV
jgi:hypothetical protein